MYANSLKQIMIVIFKLGTKEQL